MTEETKIETTATTEPVVSTPAKRGRKVQYLSNVNLLREIALSHEQGRMTEEFGKMIQLLVDRVLNGHQWRGYTYKDEFRGNCIVMLCAGWKSFNTERSNNPFAYFTQICTNACIRSINAEKKQSKVKDTLYEDYNQKNQTGYTSDSDLWSSKDVMGRD